MVLSFRVNFLSILLPFFLYDKKSKIIRTFFITYRYYCLTPFWASVFIAGVIVIGLSPHCATFLSGLRCKSMAAPLSMCSKEKLRIVSWEMLIINLFTVAVSPVYWIFLLVVEVGWGVPLPLHTSRLLGNFYAIAYCHRIISKASNEC